MHPIANHPSIVYPATVFRGAVAAAWAFVLIVALAGCEAPKVADRSGPAQVAPPARSAPLPLPQGPPPEGFAPPPEGVPQSVEDVPYDALISPPPAPSVTLTPLPGMRDLTRVAILLPLTGGDSALGRSMLRAAQIAVFDIAGDDFQLMPYDTKGTPEAAYEAARRALAEGAGLVLGPLFSDSVRAVTPLIQAAGVNLVAFSNNRAVLTGRVFLIGMLPTEQVSRVVQYARDQGAVRFAALVPDTAYGRRMVEALLIPIGGSRLKEIAALLPFYDVDTKKIHVLGVSSWRHVPGLGREPPMVGAWFAAPNGTARTGLDGRYRGIYGRPPDPLAPLAYDAAALAAVLARAEDGPDFSCEALTTPNGFAGSSGIFRFAPSGEAQRGLAILEIGPWQVKEIGPAPETFEELEN